MFKKKDTILKMTPPEEEIEKNEETKDIIYRTVSRSRRKQRL